MIYFKLPFDKSIFTTNGNSLRSFINFTSFNENEQIHFTGNLFQLSPEDLEKKIIYNAQYLENSPFMEEQNKQEYLEKITNVVQFLKDNNLPKLVISRRKIIKYSEIDISKSFLNLCENYPNAFVYFFVENGVCWMGAFSEILGKFNKETSEFETMSLAGTLPISENWTTKEIEEQKTVTDYISNILSNFSNEVKQSDTYDHISGNIKHLRTDFSLYTEENSIKEIISKLHPTPAVCGIPKYFCKKAIHNFEKYPREFYAGFSQIETDEYIYFFVNLRCGKFFKNEAHLFVGGGITTDSIPEKEWQETELKAEAVAKNLVLL